MIKFIKKIFTQGSTRSVATKRNILYSVIFKAISIGVSLLIVPLTLSYLSKVEYGIWLTLFSMLAWISYFDIGLTNGLRNKLTEALAEGDKQKAKIYISTTLFLLAGIVCLIILISVGLYKFVNWNSVFNTSEISSMVLGRVVFITIAFFGLQFIFKVVIALYYATQRSAVVELMGTLGSLFSLAVIYMLTKVTASGSLLYVAVVFSAAPVLVYVVAYFITFYGKYRYLLPSVKSVNLNHTKDLLGLGVVFFVIQVSIMILFTTSNIIIAQLFGPEEVTIYNIAFKYFNVVTMGFMIVLTPLWNAYTDAYTKGDFDWIGNVMRKIILFWILSLIGTVGMILVSSFVYSFWVGVEIGSSITIYLSIACAAYVSIFNWHNIMTYFLNGVGKIRLQFYVAMLGTLSYVPLAIYMGKAFGVSGVLWAQTVILFFSAIIYTKQYRELIKQKATGLWNK